MTNDEMNAVAQQIADAIRTDILAGQTADDVSRHVFVEAKTAIAEAYAAGKSETKPC